MLAATAILIIDGIVAAEDRHLTAVSCLERPQSLLICYSRVAIDIGPALKEGREPAASEPLPATGRGRSSSRPHATATCLYPARRCHNGPACGRAAESSAPLARDRPAPARL